MRASRQVLTRCVAQSSHGNNTAARWAKRSHLRTYCDAKRGLEERRHSVAEVEKQAAERAEVEAQAAAAEVSAENYSSDTWPDGTPKRYRGREAWKNWIEFNSPYTSQADELNRLRHYFFHVDSRGRLWRKELHRLDEHDGEMRDPRTLDYFFGHMQPNATGLHQERFPFLSRRAHEHYFTSCAVSPIVFNDLREGELRLLCPDGDLAPSVTTTFEPASLRLTCDGQLFHPCATKAVDEVGARPPRALELMALLESSTAQQLLECCELREAADGTEEVVLRWGGKDVALRRWEMSTMSTNAH